MMHGSLLKQVSIRELRAPVRKIFIQCGCTGVDGVDVVIGTSSFLREFSHGKDMAYITKTAIEVIEFVKSKGTLQLCSTSCL